jgi:transcriptional regulator with XRE-family HTH domain
MAPRNGDLLLGIARNIERLMSARQFSIAELARRSEISEARIGKLLAGRTEPSATELLRLAGSLDVTISELLEGIVWEEDGEGGGSFRTAPDGG